MQRGDWDEGDGNGADACSVKECDAKRRYTGRDIENIDVLKGAWRMSGEWM